MSKFPMDLSKFKKISSDGNVSVLRHADGHEIKIAHNKLSQSLRAKLEKLPSQEPAPQLLYDGGVGGEPQTQDAGYTQLLSRKAQALQARQPELSYGQALAQAAVEAQKFEEAKKARRDEEQFGLQRRHEEAMASLPKTAEEERARELGYERSPAMAARPISAPAVEAQPMAPSLAAPAAAAAPAQAPADALGISGLVEKQMAGLEEQRRGAQMGVQAQQQLGARSAEEIAKTTDQLQAQMQEYQRQNAEVIAERQRLRQEIDANQVNPRQFLERMSTGDRIMKGISMFLGGVGSGLTGGPNVAYDYLNKQIDRDIDAQKLGLEKRMNLLRHNYQDTQDLREATDRTRMQMNDILSAHLRAEAARAQNIAAQGQLLEIAGKFDMQNAQLQHSLAVQKAMMAGLGGGADDEQKFKAQTQLLRMSGQEAMAKDLEAKHVPGIGQASVEVPLDLRKQMAARQDLQTKLADLMAFSEKHSGSFNPEIINQGRAKARSVQDAYRQANNQGVFKESEADFVESIISSNPTKLFSDVRTKPGYMEAAKHNLESLDAMKRSVGLPVSETIEYRGKLYKRGPNGEAIPVQ